VNRYHKEPYTERTAAGWSLWGTSPRRLLCYGHKSSTGTVRRLLHQKSYDSTASVWFLINFLDIVRCPVNFRYYIKFHGARTAFGRVIEDKMTSAGHRTAPGRCLHTSDGHRTIFVWDLYRTIPTVLVRAPYGARPGIVRCLTSAWNFKKYLNKSADARPGTGRCPFGHRPMFYESNCHRREATRYCRRT